MPIRRLAPGLAVVLPLALLAMIAGIWLPLIGGAVLAIAGGVGIRTLWALDDRFMPGLRFASRTLLQAAIIVSGFALSFTTVLRTGAVTLPVTIATVTVALVAAWLIGRALQISGTLQLLIGVGTAICGASAIAAVASVVEPDDADLALAIATIFLFNLTAVLAFPPLGHLMALSQASFGIWAGTAINDTSSVVAAGYVYGREAGAEATVVKLARATLILPIVGVIAILHARRMRSTTTIAWRAIVPWFILWFLAAAIVNTAGVIPLGWHGAIVASAAFLITCALGAIGLQTQIPRLLSAGPKPLAFGFLLWVLVAATSLAVQRMTGI